MAKPPNKDIVFEIVDEPMPPKVQSNSGTRTNWAKLLEKVKVAPGWKPRVLWTPTEQQKNYYIRLMREYLRKHCPLEKWEFESAKMQDVKGGYGIWACYRGTMTPEEYEQQQLKYKLDSERRIKEKALAKVRREQERVMKGYQDGVIRPSPTAG